MHPNKPNWGSSFVSHEHREACAPSASGDGLNAAAGRERGAGTVWGVMHIKALFADTGGSSSAQSKRLGIINLTCQLGQAMASSESNTHLAIGVKAFGRWGSHLQSVDLK